MALTGTLKSIQSRSLTIKKLARNYKKTDKFSTKLKEKTKQKQDKRTIQQQQKGKHVGLRERLI